VRERLRSDLGVAPAPAVVERARRLGATVAAADPLPIGVNRSAEVCIVGRVREQQALSDAFARAAAGEGSVVCVSGEAGIGKTTLVEAWLGERLGGASMWVVRGRCSERLAGAEAYLPLLDALERLVAGPEGVAAAAVLRRVAPLWYAELTPSNPPEPAAPSPQRLKRQLVAFFQELSRSRPVVFFLDDLHWSDSTSVDFLAYLTTRLRELRVLVVVTYREDDLRAARHEFLPLALDLQARGVAREVPLSFFSVEEVARYAERELTAGVVTPKLVDVLHGLSEGSPLFVAELVRELRVRMQGQSSSADAFACAAGSLAGELPRSVRSMVRRKVERLGDDDRRLLAVASVQGVEFDAPVVAAAMDLDPVGVEERLDAMAHDDGVVRRTGERALAGGVRAARYRFVHALYQNTLHSTLGPARLRAASAAVADALVAQCDVCTTGIDAQLAVLYEAAGDSARAVKHYTRAADDAARLVAHREAVLLCRRALALLPSLPDTTERTLTEMRLQFSVGYSTMIVDGYTAPEAQAAHAAAAALAAQFDNVESVFPLIAGLFGYYCVAGNIDESARLATRMGEVANADATSPLVVMSDLAGGLVQHSSGNQAAAHATFEHAIARYEPAHHAMHIAMYRFDPGIFSLAQSARTFWLLGFADQALARAERAVEMARELEHPGSIAFALTFLSVVRHYRREATEALASAEETLAFCDAHEIAQERAWTAPIRGSALAALGRTDEGVAFTREAVAAYAGTGAQHSLPYYHAMLAETLLSAGSTQDALVECDTGLATSARIGEVAYDAELHRLRGECLLRCGAASKRDAERELDASLHIARTHGARLYELRAATSLASLWRAQGRVTDARTLLAATTGWFTEGLDTADLLTARHLLSEL
jgi:predicted ATPase